VASNSTLQTSIEPQAQGVKPIPLIRHPNTPGPDKHQTLETAPLVVEDKGNFNHGAQKIPDVRLIEQINHGNQGAIVGNWVS